MEKLKKDALKIDFFGKEYIFERLNPFTVRITTGSVQSIVSFTGELSVDTKRDFYEMPYLIKFKDSLHLSPKSQLKFFLKLPLITKLMIVEKSLEVDRHTGYNRKAWQGEVHKGELCTYVEAEFAFEIFETKDALMPLRILNKSEAPREISRIMIEPENLLLVKGDNGLFTNKVYLHTISPIEYSVEYGTRTTIKAINPKLLIDRKISVARIVLTRFDKFGIARELGL